MEQKKQQPSSDTDLRGWNESAKAWSEFVERGDPFREQLVDPVVFGWLGNMQGKAILDAGCGEGYVSRKCAAQGARMTSVDGAEEFIRIAKEKSSGGAIDYRVADLRDPLPLKDGMFDAVVCNLALMDFDPIEDTLREFHRVLKSGGELIISILHPAFCSCELGGGGLTKDFKEFILHQPPHYKVLHYHTSHRDTWHVRGVGKATAYYHRSISFYLQTLHASSFTLRDVAEPVLSKDFARGKSNFMKLSTEVPPFLLLRMTKN